jgi:hypothetical protein
MIILLVSPLSFFDPKHYSLIQLPRHSLYPITKTDPVSDETTIRLCFAQPEHPYKICKECNATTRFREPRLYNNWDFIFQQLQLNSIHTASELLL